MAGLIDLPTATEFMSQISSVVPSEDRDFSRPKEWQTSSDAYIPAASTFVIQPMTNTYPNLDSLNAKDDKSISDSLLAKFHEISDKINNLLQKYKNPEQNQQDKKVDGLIKEFQTFFAQNQPIIGQLYSGPIDGQLNDKIVSAAKQAEGIIGSKIGQSVAGQIWNGKGFNTSTTDVKTALSLIQAKQK